MENYDRYTYFRTNGIVGTVPFVKISSSVYDKYVRFDKDRMRLDNVSYEYYGNPNYAWLILQANPQVTSYEYNIPTGTTLRIPYPLTDAIVRYENEAKRLAEELKKTDSEGIIYS